MTLRSRFLQLLALRGEITSLTVARTLELDLARCYLVLRELRRDGLVRERGLFFGLTDLGRKWVGEDDDEGN